MKDAAKCGRHCELQNSVNQQISERKLRPRVTPVGLSASVFSNLNPRGMSSCILGLMCASEPVKERWRMKEMEEASHPTRANRFTTPLLVLCVAMAFNSDFFRDLKSGTATR